MLDFLRRLTRRFGEWREACRQERFRQFLAEASWPENVAARERKNEQLYGRLSLTDEGFRLDKKATCEYAVRWRDIHEIQTYKHDFWSHDMICLGFRVGEDEWVEAWESMPGFSKLAERIQALYPSVPPDWLDVVVLPAFAPNQRTLWKRPETNGG